MAVCGSACLYIIFLFGAVMKKNAIFKLQDVHYSYLDKYPALCGIDLTIHAGEKIAIIGANGTGKSTLLHLLDGLIFPHQGKIMGFDKELNEESLNEEKIARQFRRKVGMVFQNADIQLFCPSVKEDIAFGPLQLGVAETEVKKRLLEISELFGVQHLLDPSPHQLSVGEKRKVAMASVFAIDPEVFILDEPTAGLDPLTTRQIVDILLEANRRGKTLITATHDLHIVADIADVVYIFDHDRKICRSGSPAEVLSDQELLQNNNLMHIHSHKHRNVTHLHPHLHLDHHLPQIDKKP
jgi:cobalt/nickel transport system ATP-binding protein